MGGGKKDKELLKGRERQTTIDEWERNQRNERKDNRWGKQQGRDRECGEEEKVPGEVGAGVRGETESMS